MRYGLTLDAGSTGAVANTFKTMLALIAANTAGYRARLFRLEVGPGEAPQDESFSLKLWRTNNATAGTPGSTVTAANMPKFDSLSRDSIISGGLLYSAEPTTFDNQPLLQQDFNFRGGFLWETDDPNKMFKFGLNQTLCVLAAPRVATARKLSISVGYEEF